MRLTVVACILLCVAANAQTKRTQKKVLGESVTWRVSCDKVFGAALTMPGAQQVDNRTDGLSSHPDGSPAPAPYALTVPFDGQDTPPGQDTLVELWPVPNAKAALGISVTKDQELCWMMFPMPYPFPSLPFHQMDKKEANAWLDKQPLTKKVMREERAWICEVAKLVPDAKCPVDSEFQKTSMMEIKRIAAEAGY